MALRSLSLCAGIGGIDLGLARWARSVCYVERDAYAASVLVARMEDKALDPAPVWSDLATFDARAWHGRVDLVTGGYPCQPFSHAGKRRGTDDERHLWPHVFRILTESGASLGFFENVRGHLSLGLSDVLADLAGAGWDAEWCCVRASDVGAPHRRERLFILAYRDEPGREQLRRCGLLDGERAAQRNDADGRGADVADSARIPGGEWPGRKRVLDARQVNVADALGLDDERRGERGELDGESGLAQGEGDQRERSGDAHRDCGEAMGHAIGARLEIGRSDPVARAFPAAWPPSPTDADGWRRWIEQGGPEPVKLYGFDAGNAEIVARRALRCAVPGINRSARRREAARIAAGLVRSVPKDGFESPVRGGSYGSSHRMDRLRCLGNAVVPQQAALAWRILTDRIMT